MNAVTPIADTSPGLATFMAAKRPKSPTGIVWPRTLPIELALKTATPPELQVEYGYTDEEWAELRVNPFFIEDLKDACELVRQEGMSFKLKAALQAEELLGTSWRLIHAKADEVPASVKADLIKSTMRWAGYDNKATQEAGSTNLQTLAIQINLPEGY